MKTNRANDVVMVALVDVGVQKIQVIKEVRAITGLGLKEAKDLVDAVASAPQLVGGQVSAERAGEIRFQLESAGAVVKVVSANGSKSDDAALAETFKRCADAKKKAQRAEARAARKLAQEQERRESVQYLLYDKIQSKIRAFASDLKTELDWFKEELVDSGVDFAMVPGTAVQIEDTPQGPALSLVVSFRQ